MQVHQFTFNAFAENTYLIHDSAGQCAIVDPGMNTRTEQAQLETAIEESGLTPVLLLNTHCHVDHVFGNTWVKQRYQVPLLMHRLEVQVLEAAPTIAQLYGFPTVESPPADDFLEPGRPLALGELELEVLFTPGHSPGEVCFYHRPSGQCLVGDVLFRGSIGRTDLPGGDYPTLMRSLKQELLSLPPETICYPGHGPKTTLAEELRSNPFLKD